MPFGTWFGCAQPLHPPSIFVGNSPYLRGTKFVPQYDMTSFDKFFLDWSKVQRSKLRQLCSFELFVSLRRIRGYEEHALVRAYTSSSTTCPPIGGTRRKNIIEVALGSLFGRHSNAQARYAYIIFEDYYFLNTKICQPFLSNDWLNNKTAIHRIRTG